MLVFLFASLVVCVLVCFTARFGFGVWVVNNVVNLVLYDVISFYCNLVVNVWCIDICVWWLFVLFCFLAILFDLSWLVGCGLGLLF